MSFIILFLTAAWFVLAPAEPAHAEPISGLIAAISTAIASASVLTKIVLGIAFNLASSLLQKALTKTPQQKPIGVKLDIEIGDDIPVSTVVGFYATAGKRKYVQTWGDFRKTPNANLTQVIELGNLPMSKTGLQDLVLWVDDQKVEILLSETPGEKGYPIKQFRDDDDRGGDVGSGIDDYAWIKFYNGTQSAADPFLIEHFGDEEDRPWTSDMIGRGVPYAIMTYRYRPKYFNSVPSTLFVSRGIPLYDIRKDSTNGGNGAHRWDDQSTWEPSDNAAVIIYNIIRGLRYQSEWFFGGQNLAASRLPASNWIAAANECGRQVAIKGDKTEPQFRAGLEITGDMEPLEVIDSLRAACNGRIAEIGGSFKMQVGAFGAAVFSFTDADVVITKGQSFEPFPTLDDTVNQINISYPNPDEKWGTKDGPALTAKQVNDAVTGKSLFEVDGNRVLAADVQLPAVPFDRQAQRLRRAMIKEERRFRTHRFYLPPEAWVLEPNDVLSWSSERNGYDNKRFIVTDIQGEATMNQLVTIREMDPADYDWTSDFELPTTSGYLGPLEVPPQPMEGWTASATSIPDAAGRGRRPAIRVTAASNLDDVRNVRVQVRVAATDVVVFDSGTYPYDAPYSWTISGAWLLPATAYEVRGRLIAETTSRRTLWSTWLPVTTPNLLLITEDILDGAITQAKIVDAAISANKIMDGAVSALKIADKAITENKIAIGAVTKDLIASGAIVADKFAGGIGPVGIISGTTVPTTKTLDVITVAGKLYRWNGTKYTADVPAADIAGTIAGSQIAENAIDSTKFANGLSAVTNISGSTVPTTKSTDVITVAGKLYRWDGTKYTALVPTQDLTGTVTANQIGANAITAGKIAADAITSANIQAGAIKAEQISAGAISTSKLTVMDMSNLVAGELLDPAAWNGGMNTNWALLSSTTSLDEMGRVMIYSGPIVNAGAGDFVSDQYSNRFPVNVGEPLAVSVKVRGYNAARGQFRCEVNWADKDEASLGSQTVDGKTVVFSGSSATTSITAIMNPPASAVSGRLRMRVACDAAGDFVSAILIRNISVRRAASAELIVDGSISADKITSNAISADKIAANAISADKIQTNAITAGKIAAGSIDTDKLAANAITADKIDTNAITAQKIAAGAITAVKIGAGAITTDKLDAEAVTAQKIAAGTIGADQIAANSITAKNLILTDFSNLVPDNGLQDPKSWTFGGGSAAPSIGDFDVTGPALRFTGNATAGSTTTYIADAVSQYFSVKPGDELRFGATFDFNSSDDQGIRIYMNFYNADGSIIGTPAYNQSPAETLSRQTKAVNTIVPPNAVRARYYVRRAATSNGGTSAGALYVWDLFCYRRANADLIVDGAITASKVAANAITANAINVTSLEAISANLGNVNISSANIGTLTVGKQNIQSGAVTQVDSYYSSSTLSLTTSSNIQVADVAVTVASGEKVIIFGQFRVDMESSERTSMAARIYRDGSATGMNMEMDCPLLYDKIEGEFNDMDIPARYGWRGQHWVVMLQDTPGTGTFTYTLRAIRGTNGSQEASTNLRFLTAMVLKR